MAVRFAPPSIGAAEIDEVVATLRSGWLTTGPRVKAFERAFAEYAGVPHALALSSCTAALHLALLVAQIGAGDEVVTTPLTFCATANTIVHAGATPRFADIDPVTWNLSPDAAADAVTSRTRAVLPVHYAGRPADTAGFRSLAALHGLVVIEDAAHCVEGVSAGAKIGSTADLTCFSFYATKNLTTGEGGMLTTRSAEWDAAARTASLHGMSHDAWARYASAAPAQYDVVLPGFKYNMMDLQAAIGLQQLATIQRRLRRREQIWRAYDEALADLPLIRPAPIASGDVHARHLYTILVDPASGWTRDGLAAALADRGVSTSIHFRAVHLHSYYRERFRLRTGMFPHAERVASQVLSLPLSPALTDEEVAHVTLAVRDLVLRRR
ncbi:MAG: DegT/DnrJ/EryC1/StrS family aminotransferase [Acidobacteria bacterium]|nr:DegT/DnrJ/EryC1/StrS family aminotransferase [Acidobacteriota bacterium]